MRSKPIQDSEIERIRFLKQNWDVFGSSHGMQKLLQHPQAPVSTIEAYEKLVWRVIYGLRSW